MIIMSKEIETKKVEKSIEHPLEKVFDIEQGTTVISHTERSTKLVAVEEYDDMDTDINLQFEEIYNSALAGYEDQVEEAELVEGKYKARMMEVGAQLLNTALAAAKEKSSLKQHKDKITIDKGKLEGKTVNNNLIVADRNVILRALSGKKDD